MSDSHPAACANCAAPLHGAYCHQCGQAAHSPVRSFGHAVEEVFESFWHLDGRIFRTLRRLLVPGALAHDYLAGQRAPYVAPMRLFVILCVLTFFVGKGVIHFGDTVRGPDAGPAVVTSEHPALASAGSIEAVEQARERIVAELGSARDEVPAGMAPMRGVFDRSIVAAREEANRRIVELGGTPEPLRRDELVTITGLDGDDGWFARQALRIQHNVPRLQQDPELLKFAFMGSVPTALFVLVPLFALLLKLFYVATDRLYLEHLVVALYSHAFLCLALLGQFALVALDRWIAPQPGMSLLVGVPAALLWLWMPAYLLLMQKRVYAQGWLLTTAKFACIGGLYAGALLFCAMGLLLVSLVRL